jgi:group I intron endonuclease
MASGIYEIVNLANGHRYIGSAVDLKGRWRTHRANLNGNKHHNKHLQSAWNKYGPDRFEFRVIEHCFIFVLIFREQHYIDTLKPQYNTARKAGSPLGIKHTAEELARMSASQKGLTRSPETRARIKASKQNMSAETRAKMSASAKRRKASAEARANMAAAQTGRKHPPEVRSKISASVKKWRNRQPENG